MIGTMVGPYQVVEKLGAGGMGEVFRARDMRLQRDVAIKVLPELLAADPERLARFEREAQALAAVNHPGIAHVYGVVEGPPPALVMELVEGEDLSQLIARGAVPLGSALPIARQIADALEAAHERGIVHRDLKPANVKVRDDGTVKVLDFGLAKLVDRDSTPGVDPQHSPTFTSPARTQMGVILGTAAYMAPEQAKGRPVDRRADIWAFGCVLFEMLTGRAPFAHDSVAETLGAVVSRDPDWTLLPRDLPPSIRQLLRRCLDRDPRTRLRDIGEARVALTGDAPEAPALPAARGRPWLNALGLIGLGAAGGVGLAVAIWSTGAAVPAPTPATFALRQLTELPGPELHPDISPDGRQVLFTSAAAGNRDIYLLRVGGARPLNLTADSRAHEDQGAFSPDGERIAFRSDREGGGIYVMGATGESVRLVTREGFDPAWSPDGKSLAYGTEPVRDPYSRYGTSQLWRVDVVSGSTARVTDSDAVQPDWSPDGGRIAYWANTGGQRDIWTVDAGGGEPVPVTQDAATDWSPEWSPDGAWLYFSSDRGGNMNIWRVAIDQQTGLPRGAPEAITNSVTGVGYVRFGADQRRAVVMAYSTTYELLLSAVDNAAASRPEPTSVRSPSLGWCSPSPTSDWLACTSRAAQEDIVLVRPNGSDTVRLTDDVPKDRNPTWSPDGSRIAFMSTRSGEWESWSIRRDGSDLRQMTNLKSDIYETVWSPDGRRAMTSASTRPPYGIWIYDVASMATRENATFFQSPVTPRLNVEAWSPDGKLVAGSILDGAGSPRQPVVWEAATGVVRTLDVPPPPLNQFSFAVAGWLPDSRRFLFASGNGIVVVDAATGRWTPFQAPENAVRYRLSGDGRTLYSERHLDDADIWLLESIAPAGAQPSPNSP